MANKIDCSNNLKLTVVSVQEGVSWLFSQAVATVLGDHFSPHYNVVYPFVPLPPIFSSPSMVGVCIHPPGHQNPKSSTL